MRDKTRPSPLPRLSAVGCATATLLLLQASAHAQQAAPAPATAASGSSASASASTTGTADRTELTTVVITANKRVERLEQVPLAISVMNAEDLDRNNVRGLDDVALLSPALSITYG